MKTQAVFKMPQTLGKALDEVDRMLATGNLDLVLDFSGCQFVTVDGLEWLEELLLRASSLSSNIQITNVEPAIYKVFKVARIEHVLKACGSATPQAPVC
jgi:anti-anti-sigma regulatory factor